MILMMSRSCGVIEDCKMSQDNKHRNDDLIDLGTATAETKGPPLANTDSHGGHSMALSND